MAGWRVIERTGQTLTRLIERRLTLAGVTGVTARLATTASFGTLAASESPVISVLLYQVSENPERRNAAQIGLEDGRRLRQPLALELCYLITPWGSRGEDTDSDILAAQEEARLLGLILQALYDGAEIGTGDLFDDPVLPVWRAGENLQVILESLPLEDHYRIWDASELGYRLSLTYRVRVAYLDSVEETLAPLVTEGTFEGHHEP